MIIKYTYKDRVHRGEIDGIEKVYLGNYTIKIIWNRMNMLVTEGNGHSFENALEWALAAYATYLTDQEK